MLNVQSRNRNRNGQPSQGTGGGTGDSNAFIMVNLQQVNEVSPNPFFANAMEQQRGYAPSGASYSAMSLPLDANGYPQVDCVITLTASALPGSTTGQLTTNGTYLMKWKGVAAHFGTTSGTGWSITGVTGPVAGFMTANFVVTDCTQNIQIPLTITGNGAIDQVQMMRPGIALSYSGTWNPDVLAYYAQFNGIRTMKCSGVERLPLPEDTYTLTWTGGGTLSTTSTSGTINGSLSSATTPSILTVPSGTDVIVSKASGTITGLTVVRNGGSTNYGAFSTGGSFFNISAKNYTWADRITPKSRAGAASQEKGITGLSIEELVDFGNQVFAQSGSKLKKMWFNIYHHADDTYVTNYMTYVRDNLNPAITVFFENGNELWNTGFYYSAIRFQSDAIAEVAAGGSDLDYDSSGRHDWWGVRFAIRRSAAMAAIGATVFGGNWNTRAKMVAGTWLSDISKPLADLYYAQTQRGINVATSFAGGLSMSLYTFLADSTTLHNFANSAAMVNYYETDPTNGRPGRIGVVKQFQEIAGRFKIPMITYEGGPDLSWYKVNSPATSTDVLKAANGLESVAMGTHITNLASDWFSYGGQELTHFNGGLQLDPVAMATAGVTDLSSYSGIQVAGVAAGYTKSPRLTGVLNELALQIPTTAGQNIRSRIPATLSMANYSLTDHQIFNARDSWLDFTGSSGNMVLNAPGTTLDRWVEITFYCDVTGTYTATPAVGCTASTDFIYALDGTNIHTYSAVNTGISPAGSPATVQSAITGLAITKGWHTLRVTLNINVAGGQYGVGPTIFA